MWIQILLVVAVIVIGLFLARPAGGDSHLAIRRLFMFAFVLVAIVSILFPQWLSYIANLIGVGRGADLLLYALVLAFLISVATTYRRNVQLNRRITHLAREITLARAQAEDALRRAAAVDTATRGDRPPVVDAPRRDDAADQVG
ncbi:DUF2304 domain-containing protein [Agromyces humatus]|uniref:DUF2304 domain-containing protein n=1 Tax=Agromyces humatus TaxID=279573 RepID=A0ABN2K6U4_9MICO|nr:DUF2304 domain-containing protein [Agromyces humatus]